MSDEKTYELAVTDGVQIVRVLATRLRTEEAEQLLAAVDPGDDETPPRVVLNLTPVGFVDSGALSVIWRINERTSLRLVGLAPLVENTFKILGMLNILRYHDAEDEAMAAFAEQAR